MAKKVKIPKRFVGVKIPKALRTGIRDLARTQHGRTLLAEALAAAGGLLVAHEAQPGSRTREFIDENAPRAKAKGKALAAQARSWSDPSALENAARAFTARLRDRADATPTERDLQTPPIAPH